MVNYKLPEEVQKSWSIALIAGIFILFVIYLCCTPVSENTSIVYIAIAPAFLTILTGAYIYIYRGRKSRVARIVFTLLLLLSLLLLFGLYYLMGLASAYRN